MQYTNYQLQINHAESNSMTSFIDKLGQQFLFNAMQGKLFKFPSLYSILYMQRNVFLFLGKLVKIIFDFLKGKI